MARIDAYRKPALGFTLIEVLIVVAIIGFLAAIAMPAYTDYVIRGKIPDATSALAAKRVQMEQYFQDNRSYTNGLACMNDDSTSQYFSFSCANLSDTTYTLQAVGKASMAGFTYTLDQNNGKASSIVDPAPSGWIGAAACWITRKGGGC